MFHLNYILRGLVVRMSGYITDFKINPEDHEFETRRGSFFFYYLILRDVVKYFAVFIFF